jgi:hypothetical protein
MKPASLRILAYYYGFQLVAIFGNAFVARRSHFYARHVVQSENIIEGVL